MHKKYIRIRDQDRESGYVEIPINIRQATQALLGRDIFFDGVDSFGCDIGLISKKCIIFMQNSDGESLVL
jgi:hypothetical protein